MFQKAESQILGRSVFEIYPKFKKTGFYKHYEKAFKTGKSLQLEEYYGPNNKWYEGSIHPMSDGLHVQLLDITRQKRRSEELHFLNKAGTILASSLDYKKTLNRVVRLAIATLSDWCVAEMIGEDGVTDQLAIGHSNPLKIKLARDIREKYPPDPNAPEGTAAVISSGKSFVMTSVPDELLAKSARSKKHLSMIRRLGITSYMIAPMKVGDRVIGTITFVSSTEKRLFTKADLPLAEGLAARAALAIENAKLYLAAQQEIERRQKTEEELLRIQDELRFSKDQIETIIQSSGDGITLQDDAGRLVYANNTAAYTSGFSSPEAMISSPPEAIFERFEMIDESGKPFPVDKLPGRRALKGDVAPEEVIGYRIKKTGKERWSMVRATPLLNTEGEVKYAVNIFHDITEQKMQERRKNEFISIASHELKTPVATLKILSQALRDLTNGRQKEKKTEILDRFENQLDRIAALTRDLLDVSKISSGTLEIQPKRFNVAASVRVIVEDFGQMTSTHTVRLDSSKRLYVWADQARLEQVVNNLLSNAIKYSPQGGAIKVKIRATPTMSVISVEDWGLGISADNRTRIFESFFREHRKNSIAQGLGMGLFICSEIIKLHKGNIRVESQPGKGSTFYVEFPKNKPGKIRQTTDEKNIDR